MRFGFSGVFYLQAGTVLQILVGAQPPTPAGFFPGGGGGTFIGLGSSYATATPLIAAGGVNKLT